jgi:hypothetical protein
MAKEVDQLKYPPKYPVHFGDEECNHFPFLDADIYRRPVTAWVIRFGLAIGFAGLVTTLCRSLLHTD